MWNSVETELLINSAVNC